MGVSAPTPQLHTVRYDKLPALETGSAAATVATLGTCGQANDQTVVIILKLFTYAF